MKTNFLEIYFYLNNNHKNLPGTRFKDEHSCKDKNSLLPAGEVDSDLH